MRTSLVALAALAFADVAQATFIGAGIEGSLTGRTAGSSCSDSGPRIVDAGIEYECTNGTLLWQADVGADFVDVNIDNVGLPGANIGNDVLVELLFPGFEISDVVSDVFGRSRSSFTANTVEIDLPAATPEFQSFRWMITATPVPEPSADLLRASALALVLALRRLVRG